MLVSVVLGLLLAAAVPRFQRTAARLRVEQAAFELAQLLRMARARAVSEARQAVWRWDEQAHRARVELADPDGAGETESTSLAPAAQRMVESAPLPEAISISLTRDEEPVGCRCVAFFPEGTAEPTTLTVASQGHVYTVTIDAATGHARLAAGIPAR